jgi:hypothetical protein
MPLDRDLVPPEPGKDWQGSTDTPVLPMQLWLNVWRDESGYYQSTTWHSEQLSKEHAQSWRMMGYPAWRALVTLEGDGRADL